MKMKRKLHPRLPPKHIWMQKIRNYSDIITEAPHRKLVIGGQNSPTLGDFDTTPKIPRENSINHPKQICVAFTCMCAATLYPQEDTTMS